MPYKYLLCKVELYAPLFYDKFHSWRLVNKINLIFMELLNIYFVKYNWHIMQFSLRGLMPDFLKHLYLNLLIWDDVVFWLNIRFLTKDLWGLPSLDLTLHVIIHFLFLLWKQSMKN